MTTTTFGDGVRCSMSQTFWQQWVREYLQSQQQRQKWNEQQRTFAVEIMVVFDDNKPCNSRPLGQIVGLYTDCNNGLVGSIKLKTSTWELVQQTIRLCYWKQLLSLAI